MKHNVHIFTVVRVTVEDVEASSQQEAVEAAIDRVNFREIFDRKLPPGLGVPYTEWAEEDSYYLVDEVHDDQYVNSKWWKPGKDGSVVPLSV